MNFYKNSVLEVLEYLKTSESGLTEKEAEKRLLANGKNELAKPKKKNPLQRLLEQISNPMVIVLLAAAAVSLAIALIEKGGFHDYAEAGIIFAVVILNSILGIVQESKAEKAIEALQEMSASTAKVKRNGAVSQIQAKDLVVGDVVLFEAGDAIPADVRLIKSASLQIEEAALTGESVPSLKTDEIINSEEEVALGDRHNMAYAGSGVTYGRGEGVVVAIGMATEVGKIAGMLHETSETQTPLQKKMAGLSKILSLLVLGICAAVFAVRLITVGEFTINVILESFMLAVALAVAAIPEGLVAVVTIVLSIGVTNMAKRNAIIRKLPAVETLGCAQIICSDKTGTLTQNKMTVVESYAAMSHGKDYAGGELLIKAMALCCDSKLNEDGEIIGDPTENALIEYALKHDLNKNFLEQDFPRVAEAPFDGVRKMMTTIHKDIDGNGFWQFTKGAPDEVISLCSEISEAEKNAIMLKNKDYADKALRVLAVAYKKLEAVPADLSPEKIEKDLTFIGLEAMIDPIRPEVKLAVEECKNAGIKAVMITGDHKETAAAIGKELGIIDDVSQALTGRELDLLSDEDFEKRIENTFVYARVQPENKVRIVNMWKKKGFVVAMTGDGVNDAPAIKSGDIGIGMGITGTDVTKNVADMVLADDNFATIVSAVSEGRRIYDNIKKTLQFLLSSNLSEIIAILTATIMGFALFRPVHLLFINLITDTFPAVALGMERAQPDIMNRPPRGQKDGVFSEGVGFNIIYQGVLIAGLTLASYFIANSYLTPEEASTAAFLTLTMCEIFQAFSLRSIKQSIFSLKSHNKALWGAMAFSLTAALAVIYVPALAETFSLVPLSIKEFGLSLGLGFAVLPFIEAVKFLQRKLSRKNK